jgi:ABC-2 type transport system ATP-binding protein
MSPAIEFENVRKTYRQRFSKQKTAALEAVSFAVQPGEVCGFLGPNGAGKTTSIHLLMGFLFADSGQIRVLDYGPGDIRSKERIGFLPENFAFYRHLTAPELLRFHLALSRRRNTERENRIPELLARVKLSEYEHLKIGRYSRGMVQRLGLAQALLADPQLLILDEPTSGLDPAGREEVLDLLNQLKAEGRTVFLSSHILPEVEQVCDRIIIIDRGRLIRAGRLSELIDAGDQVEIVVDALPAELQALARERSAAVERTKEGVRLLLKAAHKREFGEKLWASGCDVISINPVRSTLQDLFLKLVNP